MSKISEAAAMLGKKGGKSKSPAKVAASRRNAKKICDKCKKKFIKLTQQGKLMLCSGCLNRRLL